LYLIILLGVKINFQNGYTVNTSIQYAICQNTRYEEASRGTIMSEEDRERLLGTSNVSFGKQMDCLKKISDETKSKEADAIPERDEIRQAVELNSSSSICHRLGMSIGVQN
jgi:hypothetical protein